MEEILEMMEMIAEGIEQKKNVHYVSIKAVKALADEYDMDEENIDRICQGVERLFKAANAK